MNARFYKLLLPVGLVIVLALPALPSPPFAGAQEQVYYPATEWRTSTPEEQGMDSAQLLAALDYVEANEIPVDSITVIRHGYVVLDAYYHPYTADTKHNVWGATEGFVATLVGIAADQGLIAGLDQPLLALFPDRTIANRTDRKEMLTIGNLLTMSSGITCGPTDSLWAAILEAPDALGYMLDLKIELQPGAFSFCWLNSDLLSGAVEAAAGTSLLDFADQYLLGPLGITDSRWQTLPNGLPLGHGLLLPPLDMARLGYLYLHHGEWAGKQVVSSDWVNAVTCAEPAQCPFYDKALSWSSLAGRRIGYGYHWWIHPQPPYFYISGVGGLLAGQLIAVAPEYDMVVVLTSRSKTEQQDLKFVPFELIGDLIIGTASVDGPLPANPDAVAVLKARVEALAHPTPQAVTPLPKMAAQVNGVDYTLAPPVQLWTLAPRLGDYLYGAPLQVDGFKLTFDSPDAATLELEFSDGYKMALPVGLDGVNRVEDTRIGRLAATGQWAPTGKGFAINLEFVGAGEQRQITFGTLGKNVIFICQDVASGIMQPPATAQPRE